MTDNRFKDFPVDARFPSLGRDVRFEDFPTDKRFTGGLDTRFQGPAYGGGGAIPVITGVPTISGTAAVGNVLTASPAPVTGDPTPTRTWQWYRGGVAISGATSTTYTLVLADSGATITVEQIETNTEGFDTAVSAGVAVAFTPASLFALGEQGAWFRPNNLATNFTAIEAIAAQAMVGGTVGLLLSATNNYGLGPELVTNGSVTGSTGWSTINPGTVVFANNRIEFSGAGGIATNAATTYTNGRLYRVEFTVSGYVSGTVSIQLSNGGAGPAVGTAGVSANGTYVAYLLSNGNTTARVIANTSTLNVDDISVREVLGNHVVQATAGARATLRQEAGPGAYFIEDDGGDTMPWTAPAGTYTVAYVIPDGTVTILTGQALSGATDALIPSQLVEYVAVNRALTPGETSGLTAYLQSVANP